MTIEYDEDNDERFKPNYMVGCEKCEVLPTVDDSGICGACYFGEADCVYPENW